MPEVEIHRVELTEIEGFVIVKFVFYSLEPENSSRTLV